MPYLFAGTTTDASAAAAATTDAFPKAVCVPKTCHNQSPRIVCNIIYV